MNKDTIYEEFYNKLYNPDVKIEFIEEKYPFDDDTKKAILFHFIKTKETEQQLEKDLSIFSIKDIDEVAGALGYASENTIRGALSYFLSYTDWCIETGKRGKNENGVNDFPIFLATHELSPYVSKFKVEHRYVTREEVLDMTYKLVNFVDKATVLALYEGIGGEKLHELRSLKKSIVNTEEFKNNKLTVTDINEEERVVTISDELKNILQYASSQEEYIRANGNDVSLNHSTPVMLSDSEYIIRSSYDKESVRDEMIKYSTLSQKFVVLKAYIGYDFVTPQSLRDSGAINRVIELTKENGLEKPTKEIFSTLKLPTEYNFSNMQIYNLKKKFDLATSIKEFE